MNSGHDRPTGPVGEDDLLALVDGQLGLQRKLLVEAHVRGRPEVAARILQDRWAREEVGRFLDGAELPPGLAHLGRRLQRRLVFWPTLKLVRAAAAAVSLIALGWVTHALVAGPSATPAHATVAVPGYIDAAMDAYLQSSAAHPAPHLPVKAASRLLDTWFDRPGKATPIPEIPGDSTIIGMNVDPGSDPPALKIDYQVGPDRVVLYVVKDRIDVSRAPRLAVQDATPVAYWQMGHNRYALIGLPAKRLLEVARIMAFAM